MTTNLKEQITIAELRAVLFDAKEKLELYYANQDKEYIGGIEYSALMRRIQSALSHA